MRSMLRMMLASVAAVGTWLSVAGGGSVAHAGNPPMRVMRYGQAIQILAPDTPFTVLARGLGAPHARFCLGLASLRDRYGLPVSLGVFQAGDDGLLAVQARVPANIFPAEPAGPFLLFVGRCTNVAPDGIFAATTVTIVPALG